jgi:hypothetical protein
MKKLALALALSLTACGAANLDDVIVRDARTVNNTAALSIEAAQSTAELLYRAEQLAVVERESAKPGATKETVRTAVEKVRSQWAPVKELFRRAREAQARLAVLLRAGAAAVEVVAAVGEMTALQTEIAKTLSEARSRLGG